MLQDGTGRSSNVEVEEYDADKLLDKMRALKDRLLDLSARSNEKIDVTALLQLRVLGHNAFSALTSSKQTFPFLSTGNVFSEKLEDKRPH